MSAQSGFTHSHNALANKINSERILQYIDGVMHSIFAGNFDLSQVKNSGAQIHTLQYYIAENVACLTTFVGSVRHLFTLLRYTLPYYSIELYQQLYNFVEYSTLIHCWTIPNTNTLLR